MHPIDSDDSDEEERRHVARKVPQRRSVTLRRPTVRDARNHNAAAQPEVAAPAAVQVPFARHFTQGVSTRDASHRLYHDIEYKWTRSGNNGTISASGIRPLFHERATPDADWYANGLAQRAGS